MKRSRRHLPPGAGILLLVCNRGLLGCVVVDEPVPPQQDTGASDPDCNQAFQDALDAGLCLPPASLVINFNLGSTDYIYVDDPYFEAIGAVGVFGPGVGGGLGGAIAGGADSVARVIESNGACEILCTYDIVSCNAEYPICIGFFGGTCLYCNDPSVTIQQCQDFLDACLLGGESAGDTSATSNTGTTDTGADSTG